MLDPRTLRSKAFTAALLVAIGVASSAARAAADVNVGMVTRQYTDESRTAWEGAGPRPLTTVIWYPVAATRKLTFVFDTPKRTPTFFPVAVAPDAPLLATPSTYPLVLLSHASGSSALQMIWLGYYLASRGFIVAAVNHHGNTSEEARQFAQGATLVWERPRDLSVVLDRLLADPMFGSRIDPDRIGAAGFSLGGYTVIALAGARFSVDAFEAFCHSERRDATCERPETAARISELRKGDVQVIESIARSGDSYRDARIQRVFAIAPTLGGAFAERALIDVKVPVRIVASEADTLAPLQTNAVRYVQLIPQAELRTLLGGIGHHAFLATCTPHGRSVTPLCEDAKGVDRVQVHREVANMAYAFFSGTSTPGTASALR